MTKEKLIAILKELKAEGKNPHGYLRELAIDLSITAEDLDN